MKTSGPIKRKTALKRSTTPIRKVNPTAKAKRVAKQKAFYSSAAWKRIRKGALERAGNQCEYVEVDMLYTRCEANWYCTKLHVHHKKGSVRFGGDELPEDLQVLCEYHHSIVERRDFPHRHQRR